MRSRRVKKRALHAKHMKTQIKCKIFQTCGGRQRALRQEAGSCRVECMFRGAAPMINLVRRTVPDVGAALGFSKVRDLAMRMSVLAIAILLCGGVAAFGDDVPPAAAPDVQAPSSPPVRPPVKIIETAPAPKSDQAPPALSAAPPAASSQAKTPDRPADDAGALYRRHLPRGMPRRQFWRHQNFSLTSISACSRFCRAASGILVRQKFRAWPRDLRGGWPDGAPDARHAACRPRIALRRGRPITTHHASIR